MALKTYPNGLRLSVIPKKGVRLASAQIHITSGTQSEKNYESGISEFLSRMLMMGTSRHPKNRDLIGFAKSNGILLSSHNTSESIVVTATTIADNITKAIEILCEIAFESAFEESSGDIIRDEMLGYIVKLQENPSYTLDRMVNQALFYRTGLANPKFGTITTISRMTASDAKAFLERVLTPKNTIISVVGDVDADAVYEKVMNTFYSKFLAGGDYKKLKYVAPIEDFVGGERTKNKKLNQSRIFLAFPSVSYKSIKKHALEIALPIIIKRIDEEIKDDLKDVSFFHSESISHELFANNGKLTIETMVDYEHVEEYLDVIVDSIKHIKDSGVAEAEFEVEKNAYIIKYLQDNEKASDLGEAAAKEVAINKQSYSLASELMKIELLTVADANKIVESVFDFKKLFIAYLGAPTDVRAIDYID